MLELHCVFQLQNLIEILHIQSSKARNACGILSLPLHYVSHLLFPQTKFLFFEIL